jgi:sugar lactone lactonase YvrE
VKTRIWLWGIVWTWGCTGGQVFTIAGSPGQPTQPTVPEPTPGDPTTTTTPTTTTPTTPVEPDPCLDLPVEPLSRERVEGTSPSEEFAFDANGNMLNVPDGEEAVFRTPFGGPSEIVGPFDAIEVAGVRVLLDDGLAVANEWNGTVERVDLQTGARTTLASGLPSPNSLAVSPDGMLYVASLGEVARVDLDTLEVVRIVNLPWLDLDGLTFSPDYETLYFNYDEGGSVGALDLTSDEPPVLFASLDTDYWSELDGMATDACGNVYVARVDGTIFRIDPEGNALEYAEVDAWTTALSFGSGVGGWERDHLYVMDRSEGLIELDVGIEGRPEPHLD